MQSNTNSVTCPICLCTVHQRDIFGHLDNDCPGEIKPQKQKAPIVPRNTSKSNIKLAPIFAPRSAKANMVPSRSARPAPVASRSAQKKRASEVGPAGNEAGPSKRGKVSHNVGEVTNTISSNLSSVAPLAERLRPQSLTDFVGQPHLTAPDSLLMNLVNTGSAASMILWGPPGCGKTSLARLLAKQSGAVYKELSATEAGITDVRTVADEAKNLLKLTGRRTLLFLDEVHRFNKAQQDVFLPFVEQGVLQLIGATTENPSFKVTSALLSRCRVFVLNRLTDGDLELLITQAVKRVSLDTSAKEAPKSTVDIFDLTSSSPTLPPSSLATSDTSAQPSSSDGATEALFPAYPHLTTDIISKIISLSSGDARTALSLLELVLSAPPSIDQSDLLASLRCSVSTSYDRTGDDRYDMISALHKSVRGSDGSAAMYWLARMLTKGEDPLYIARRMVVCASEDIGLADNHALPLAMAALQACQSIGMPECRINLAHIVAYLAEAPKSTRAYMAYGRAETAARSNQTLPVPMMVRNAPTKLMKELGYGDEYSYNPNYIHPVANEYLPPQFKNSIFLKPEGDLSDKIWDEKALQHWETLKNKGEPWDGRGAHSI